MIKIAGSTNEIKSNQICFVFFPFENIGAKQELDVLSLICVF